MEPKYPKTRRGRETFDRLVEAAIKLFYERGYYNTSINGITDTAKVSTGSFYTYFGSKYSIYRFILTKYSHEIRSTIAKSIRDDMTRKEAERIGLKAFLTYVIDNPQCYHIIWESLYINEKLFNDYYQNFANLYSNNLRDAQEKGEIAKNIDLETMAFFLMGAANFIGLRYIKFSKYLYASHDEQLETRIDNVVDDVIGMLENGIFTKEDAHEDISSKNLSK